LEKLLHSPLTLTSLMILTNLEQERASCPCMVRVSENHLKHLPEVVQTTEVWVVKMTHVSN
jgi:hypothetical protein